MKQTSQISAKAEEFTDPNSGNNSTHESQFRINHIHDPKLIGDFQIIQVTLPFLSTPCYANKVLARGL